MLRVMRDYFKYFKWALYLVILVFILLIFAQWGGGLRDPQQTGSAENWAAIVEGRIIPPQEFYLAYRNSESFFRNLYGANWNQDLAAQLGLGYTVIGTLIDREIALIEAERLGLRVSDTRLAERIRTIPILQDENGLFIGFDNYRRIVETRYGNVAAFEESLREDLLVDQFRRLVTDSVILFPEEVKLFYQQENEKVAIEYRLVPEDEVSKEVTIDEDELYGHYEENKRRYISPPRRKAEIVYRGLEDLLPNVEITPNQVEEAYGQRFTLEEKRRAQHILLEVPEGASERESKAIRERAEGIIDRLQTGEDFSALAVEHSEDEPSAAKGGDLGFFGRGEMLTPFEDAVFSLEEGELSDIVQTKNGYHIIKLLEIKPANAPPFEEIKEELYQELVAETAHETVHSEILELYNSMEDQAAFPEPFVKAGYGVKILHAMTRAEAITMSSQFSDALFSLGPQEISEPLRIEPDGWVVVRFLEAEEGTPLPFEEVQDRIEAEVRQRKISELLRERASDLLKRAQRKPEKPLKEIFGEEAIKESGLFAINGSAGELGRNPALFKKAMGLDIGKKEKIFLSGSGYCVFQVTEKQLFDEERFEREKKAFRGRLEIQRKDDFYRSFLNRIRGDRDIRFNNALINQVQGTRLGA